LGRDETSQERNQFEHGEDDFKRDGVAVAEELREQDVLTVACRSFSFWIAR
jgi:hypothetical protein